MTSYDVPAMTHLTMVIMLSSRRIIAWHDRYRSFFCFALGKEQSTNVTIVYKIVLTLVASMILVQFSFGVVKFLLYGAT